MDQGCKQALSYSFSAVSQNIRAARKYAAEVAKSSESSLPVRSSMCQATSANAGSRRNLSFEPRLCLLSKSVDVTPRVSPLDQVPTRCLSRLLPVLVVKSVKSVMILIQFVRLRKEVPLLSQSVSTITSQMLLGDIDDDDDDDDDDADDGDGDDVG